MDNFHDPDLGAFLRSFNDEPQEDYSADEELKKHCGLTTPPDIQPCEFGFECNNCGYCH